MAGSDEILSISSLKIGYQSGKKSKLLLPPLNAGAKQGELIAVIGRNGIGKSTLLRTLTGLQRPLGGSIYYSGVNINDISRIELAKNVGYISTEVIKVSNMRVYDLVSLGRFPYTNWIGKIEAKDHEIITDALEKTSMSHFQSKLISELSDGERQKVMIARILAQNTDIMVMDEPTAFLDVAGRYEILHLLKSLTRDSSRTIIYSTHDLQMAVSLSDKIWLILDDLLREGAPEDLMIEGEFDRLFDSSVVQFNSLDGTFSFRNETRGTIAIKGEGKMRHWTEMALYRAGFAVSGEAFLPVIIIPSEGSKHWQVKTDHNIMEFNSIYELMNFLGTDLP
jgi:iron complex transport system ATP-binding protein